MGLEGIAVDAAHSIKYSETEYQGIDLATGKSLFYKNIGNQTINIGEFLAIVQGCKYIIENDFSPRIIYSDSLVAISWFKNKHTSSKKTNKHLQKAEIFLELMADDIKTIQVHHWDKKSIGFENPADFGNK